MLVKGAPGAHSRLPGGVYLQAQGMEAGMESKGFLVDMKKTKFLVSGDSHDVLEKSGKCPFAVCCSGVGCNSILCSQCMLWVHKQCSGMTKQLVLDENYVHPKYKGESRPIDGRTVTEVDVDSTMLDVETTFCYLGDMLCFGGGYESAIAWRCCVAWGKFRKLLPVLSTRNHSPRIRDKVYEACVRSAMLHDCETGDQITLNCSGSATMTVLWSVGSVVSKTEMKYPQLHPWSQWLSVVFSLIYNFFESVFIMIRYPVVSRPGLTWWPNNVHGKSE